MRTLILVGLLMACDTGCGASAPNSNTRPEVIEGEIEARVVVAEGYGGTRFELDTTGDALVLVRPAEPTRSVLAQDPVLRDGTAIEVVGGRLLVGSASGLHWVSLASGEVSQLAPGIGPVTEIVTDHVGYFVVVRGGSEPATLRVAPEGETTRLLGEVGELEFDLDTRRLRVGSTWHDYLELVGESREVWEARDERPMRTFYAEGMELSGGEYGPYRGDQEPEYPEDVLWGFYPEEGVVFEGEAAPASATPAAIRCAEASHRALRTFAETLPAAFHQSVRLGTSNRFYLWVNDYSEASDPFPLEVRPARVWYWQRNPVVEGRVPGYWKWETTLTQDGECQIPAPAQARSAIEAKFEELQRSAEP